MKTILLLSSWETGSTAVTGYLDKLGAYPCATHFYTNVSFAGSSYFKLEVITRLSFSDIWS